MTAPHTSLLQLQGVHTHIGAYHILHGVEFACPERSAYACCWGAMARAKAPRCAPSWVCGKRLRAASILGGHDITRLGTPDIATLGRRLCARDHGYILLTSLCKENMLLAARASQTCANKTWTTSACQWIFQALFPSVGKVCGTTLQASSRGGKSRWWPWRAPLSNRANLLIVDEPSKGLAPSHHQQHD